MRVFLFAGAVSAVDWVPGVNPVNCGADYFRPGAEWPLESVANAGRTVRQDQAFYILVDPRVAESVRIDMETLTTTRRCFLSMT